MEALAPFQPIAMKAVHCAIDTSLNFTQANKLIRELKPSTLILPECYTQPPISHPNRTELVIEQVNLPCVGHIIEGNLLVRLGALL